jgi:HK97 family phage portal protein
MGVFSRFFKKSIPEALIPLSVNTSAKWTHDFSEEGAIREGYQASAWVYACVKKRADSVASVPLIVETLQKGEWVQSENHPLAKLIAKPSTDFNTQELLKLIVSHLDLTGNSLLLKNRASSGRILELFPLMPQFAEPIPGKVDLIAGYRYKEPQVLHTEFKSDDVVHGYYTNPSNLRWGQSPLQAAGKAVDIDNEAKNFQKISFQNRGVTDGAFSIDGEITAQQYAQLKEQIKSRFSGAANSRLPLLLSNTKYISFGSTPAEMDFMTTRNFTMKEIAAVYGVPSELISGMGDTNRASSEEVRKTFWMDTISPLLGEIAAMFNLQLVPDFGDTSTLRVRFDVSSVPALQQSQVEKLDIVGRLFALGVPMSQLNAKYELGLEEYDGWDVSYLPSGLIPAGFNLPQNEEPPELAAKNAYGIKGL